MVTTVLQIICIFAITGGIVIEIIYGAHLGFVLITLGGLLFGISEKLDKLRMKRNVKLIKTWRV
jgi:hypothetical protein